MTNKPSDEAEELEKARRSTAAGGTHGRERPPRRDGDHPHDAGLDQNLFETLPASDPYRFRRGSD